MTSAFEIPADAYVVAVWYAEARGYQYTMALYRPTPGEPMELHYASRKPSVVGTFIRWTHPFLANTSEMFALGVARAVLKSCLAPCAGVDGVDVVSDEIVICGDRYAAMAMMADRPWMRVGGLKEKPRA